MSVLTDEQSAYLDTQMNELAALRSTLLDIINDVSTKIVDEGDLDTEEDGEPIPNEESDEAQECVDNLEKAVEYLDVVIDSLNNT